MALWAAYAVSKKEYANFRTPGRDSNDVNEALEDAVSFSNPMGSLDSEADKSPRDVSANSFEAERKLRSPRRDAKSSNSPEPLRGSMAAKREV